MCGVAGVVGRSADPSVVVRMLDAIEHRGPDGRGSLVRPGLAAGMVRLAVIDPEHGDQPKTSDCGTWSVLLNGEIYNHATLRIELEAQGRRFTTRSDTEVVANAFAQWGERALVRLDGMFAIAAWHERERRLLLARDRFGEKPLYVRALADGLAFGSEAKALAAHSSFGALDRDALAAYLRLGYVPTPLSAWEDVRKLPSGTVLEVSADGATERCRHYWRLPARLDERGVVGPDDLEALLRPAVERTLVSDVEVGLLLSGGIDSSLTAWFASEAAPNVRAFTVRFEDPSKDESAFAQRVGDALGMNVEMLDVHSTDARSVVEQLPKIYDEPFADQSAIPTVLLCRAVSKEVKVALGGDGADELFNGYTMYAEADRVRRASRLVPDWALRRAERWSTASQSHLGRVGNVAAMLRTRRTGALANVRSLMPAPIRALLLDGYREPDVSAFDPGDVDDRRVDLMTYLPDDIFVKVDRASMSSGLEVRTPWMDPGLVEWALTLGPEALGPPGWKSLPRALAAKRFGDDIASRPKQGFSVPLPDWLRGPLAPLVSETLCPASVAEAALVSQRGVDLLVDRLRGGRDSAARPVWALVLLHLWYFEGRSRPGA